MLHHLFGDWDHKITGAMGLGMILAPTTLDVLARVVGVVALAVSIYCSISRNQRERRAELREQKDHE